jgi:hypothetical protein
MARNFREGITDQYQKRVPEKFRENANSAFNIIYHHLCRLNKDERIKNVGYLLKSHVFFESLEPGKQHIVKEYIQQLFASDNIPSFELLNEFIAKMYATIKRYKLPKHPSEEGIDPESAEYVTAINSYRALKLQIQAALYPIFENFSDKLQQRKIVRQVAAETKAKIENLQD